MRNKISGEALADSLDNISLDNVAFLRTAMEDLAVPFITFASKLLAGGSKSTNSSLDLALVLGADSLACPPPK